MSVPGARRQAIGEQEHLYHGAAGEYLHHGSGGSRDFRNRFAHLDPGVLTRFCSAGDKAPCRVITSVSSLTTAVTVFGTCPVLCRWKSLAAWATCWAMVKLRLSIEIVPASDFVAQSKANKKAGVAECFKAFHHVGLLLNEPHGKAGLLFIQSSERGQ
jgi:hypothetical protein